MRGLNGNVKMSLFDLFISYGIIGLFIVSFVSYIIPIPIEPVVFGLLGLGINPELIFITITAGTILGASLTYFMGKYGLTKIIRFQNKEKEKKIRMHFQKYGVWYLLISPWAPMVAGMENYDSKKFLIVISIVNIFKSIVIIYLSIKVIDWWKLLTRYIKIAEYDNLMR